MQEVYKAIGRVAPQDVTVLIRGESGTGKELVARALYQHSPRVKGQFLAVNCAAIPDALLESELFGHEKGSFTGADQRRIGKFEQCSGGTLFLDEIGDMSPLGAEQSAARLAIAAVRARWRQSDHQHRRSRHRGHEPRFGKDGRRRRISLRPLLPAERLHDSADSAPRPPGRSGAAAWKTISPCFSKELGKDVHGFSPEAMDVYLNYAWPGNVRELQNVLKQTLLRSAGHVVIPDFIPERIRSPQPEGGGRRQATPPEPT